MDDCVAQAPGESLGDYARGELDAAIARLGWRGGRLHAGVHLARKSLRRARAALALGADTLGPGAKLPPATATFDKHTTERLGVAQDLSLLLEHCGRHSIFSKPDPRALRRYAEPALAQLRHRIAHAAGHS